MASLSEIVSNTYQNSQTYAAQAQTHLTSFANALTQAVYTPPTVSFTWSTPTARAVRPIPAAPAWPEIVLNEGNISSKPTPLSESIPTISITPFSDPGPTFNFGAAPTLNFPAAPQVPEVQVPLFPASPTVTAPALPTFMELSTPTFIDVPLPNPANLNDIPALELLQPTPFEYTRGEQYASELLGKLKGVISRRLNGGSGLSPQVEQALWDRAREREAQTARGKLQEHKRLAESSGFALPSGALYAGMQQVNKEYFDGLSTLSRDISIKQAELEQQNLREAIASGMQLEGQLIEYSSRMEQLAFQHAKEVAENAIQVYNTGVQAYMALLQAYQTRASTYKSTIEGHLARVEVFKAKVQAEQMKSTANTNLVAQYRAQIDANLALVEIYKAQMGGAQVQLQAEQARIAAVGEQIRAYVARINGETARVEAYKAGVQGEVAKAEVFKAKATAIGAQMSAQAEVARVHVARYQALQGAKAAEWDGYRASVEAERARVDALGRQAQAMGEGFRSEIDAARAEAEAELAKWVAEVKQYDASIQGMLQTAKINNDAVMTANNARLDAAKAGAQVYAQLTSSAYGMLNVSAGISAGSSTSVGYSYAGDVSGSVSPLPIA